MKIHWYQCPTRTKKKAKCTCDLVPIGGKRLVEQMTQVFKVLERMRK